MMQISILKVEKLKKSKFNSILKYAIKKVYFSKMVSVNVKQTKMSPKWALQGVLVTLSHKSVKVYCT